MIVLALAARLVLRVLGDGGKHTLNVRAAFRTCQCEKAGADGLGGARQ